MGGARACTRRLLARRALVHDVGHELHRVRVRLREDAVAEVEDVTGGAASASEHVVHTAREELPRRAQEQGLEVSLERDVVSETRARLIDGREGVDTYDGAA